MHRRSPQHASRFVVALFLAAFALLGYLSAHAVAYEVADVAGDHPHVHGYFSWLEVAGGVALTIGLAGAIILAFRGTSIAGWLHRDVGACRRTVGCGGALPAAVFVVAEFAERWLAGVPLPPSTTLLAIGISVQAAIGIAAYALARWCLRLVDGVVARLRIARCPRPAARMVPPTQADGPPPPGVMARSLAGRAPPASA